MKKRPFITLIITSIILLSIASYCLFFLRITEKRYNKVMCYYVARGITRSSGSFEAKVVAIRDFVNENVNPVEFYDNRLDTIAIDKLLSGIGHCDQQVRVFMGLARSMGITSRLLFLRLASGSSPHSIAEVRALDNRWIIVDPAFRLNLITKDGRFATQDDIKNDPGIVADNERVRLRSAFDDRWANPEFLAIYYNEPIYVITTEGTKFDFLKPVPMRLLRPIVNIIQDRYLRQIKPDIRDIYEFKMLKARGYHLLGSYDKCKELYDEVIKASNNMRLVRKAEFYRAVLLKDLGKYQEAVEYISEVLGNTGKKDPYIPFLLGLKARILEKIGKAGEAKESLRQARHALEV